MAEEIEKTPFTDSTSQKAISAGMQCALVAQKLQNQFRELIFGRNARCALNEINKYPECPIFLNTGWQTQVNFVADSFQQKLNENLKNPCSNVTTQDVQGRVQKY